MQREAIAFVVLTLTYVLIACTIENSFEVIAKLFWKTATARPPVLLVAAVAGWGVVTDAATRSRIKLDVVIGPVLPMWTVLRCALGLLDVIMACRLLPFAMQHLGSARVNDWALVGDIAACAACLVLLLWPGDSEKAAAHAKYQTSLAAETSAARESLAVAIWESLLAPFAPVTFWHVIVADYATSLAKALGDAYVTACVALDTVLTGGQYGWDERRLPCVSSLLNASALALPFWCRFFQCLAVYRKTREVKNLWNAAKYSTAFPLVYAGILMKNRTVFVFWAILQSSATFGWDVLMDWGIFVKSDRFYDFSKMRASLVYSAQSAPTAHAALILFDLALRFIWTLAVFGDAPTRGAGMLCFELVEVLRRTVWALFRIEWEVIDKNHPLQEEQPLLELIC